MTTIRPNSLPLVTARVAGDVLILDGATTRSITVDSLLSNYNGALGGASLLLTATSAQALVVGPNGLVNPAFQVDASAASLAAGLKIAGAAAAGPVVLSAISSGANAGITLSPKGTGALLVTSPEYISSSNAQALSVGLNGQTNPAFNVDASTASQAAGIGIKGAATGGPVQIFAIDSGANTNLQFDAKGSGTIVLGANSTGGITLGRALTYGGVALANSVTGPAGGSLASGTQGGTWTPVDASGAALAFTGVSAQWSRVGNMIFAYAALTYPVTASGLTAVIDGLPVATPNQQYARKAFLTRSTTSGVAFMLPSANSTQIEPRNNAGVNVANSVMSAQAFDFMAVYPAS